MRSLCWKCNFRANFGVLPLGFDVKALVPQGFTGSPNYFGFLNNLITLIICESLREIGEVACVTSAWSSRGQTLKREKRKGVKLTKTFRLICDSSWVDQPAWFLAWICAREHETMDAGLWLQYCRAERKYFINSSRQFQRCLLYSVFCLFSYFFFVLARYFTT